MTVVYGIKIRPKVVIFRSTKQNLLVEVILNQGDPTANQIVCGPSGGYHGDLTSTPDSGYRGVAGQGPRVVCERFLENKVHAAQSDKILKILKI